MKHAALSVAPLIALGLALTGCITADARPAVAGFARIGGAVRSGPFTVTPLRVIEDSRCPRTALCVWAGQVRIEARITGNGVNQRSELTLGKSVDVGRSGSIGLTEVQPERVSAAGIAFSRYRFAFTFYPEG